MTPEEIKDVKALVKEFAETVSLQARVTNQVWLGMISAAWVGVVATPAPAAESGCIQLFGLSLGNGPKFFAGVFGILFVLIFAFAAAYAAQSHAQELAQEYLDGLEAMSSEIRLHGFGTLRTLYDTLRLPTFNRVAPLSQLLSGKHLIDYSPAARPSWLKTLQWMYYVVLKLASASVYFVVPGLALCYLGNKIVFPGLHIKAVTRTLEIVAWAALLEVLINDLRSGYAASQKMWKHN